MTQVLDTDKRGLVFKIVNSKIAEENVDKKHVVYSVEIRYISGTDDFSPCVIERRYTDFANLYNSIRKEHPAMTSTLTFPKKVLTGNFEMDLIGSRSSSFEALLKHICSESQLRLSPAFAHFLQEPELTYIKSLLLEKEYEFAYPLLEQSFKLLDKVYTNRSPVVLLALCRLLACSVLLPGMPGASKWSDLTLSRFDGVSDSDLLELYIPILQTCVKVYWKDGRDRSDLEKRLNDFKKQGIKIHEHVNLLDSIQAVEKKIFL